MLIFVFKANTLIIMNLKKLLFASTLQFAACGTIRAQEVIAHRGFGECVVLKDILKEK